MECLGRGCITAEHAAELGGVDVGGLKRVPDPPGVMRSPCRDCAFRPGSPESGKPPPLDRPFYCHKGMPVVAGRYAPVAWSGGVPLGALVCAGWWAAVTGQPLPEVEYQPSRDGI